MTTTEEHPPAPSIDGTVNDFIALRVDDAAVLEKKRKKWSGVYTNLSEAYEEQCRKNGCRIARFSMNPGLCDETNPSFYEDDTAHNRKKRKLLERVTVRLDNDETVTGHIFHYVKSKDYVIVRTM